jgi:hypothetical protein
MKPACCVLAILCVRAVAQEREKKSTPRTFVTPAHYYKAEEFVEMNEYSRLLYVSGLMDGFYASAVFGATDKTLPGLKSCTGEMDSKQVWAIITKYVTDHPEAWHRPLSIEAFNALVEACPGKLQIVN